MNNKKRIFYATYGEFDNLDEPLFLKSIPQITDEDAIEVAKIECRKYGSSLEKIYPNGFSLRNQIGDKDYSGIYFDYETPSGHIECRVRLYFPQIGRMIVGQTGPLCGETFDFLRSKGYLLPWRDLSVEEILKRGWAKYENQ